MSKIRYEEKIAEIKEYQAGKESYRYFKRDDSRLNGITGNFEI